MVKIFLLMNDCYDPHYIEGLIHIVSYTVLALIVRYSVLTQLATIHKDN